MRHSLFRIAVCLIAGVFPAVPACASEDAAFARVPFDRWKSEGRASQIKWGWEIPPAYLTAHQRLLLTVAVRLDGRELEKRRGPGDFLFLVQIEGADGKSWRDHVAVDLAKIQPGMASQDLAVSVRMFILPGDYTVSAAVCDPRTLLHSFASRKVRVPPLKAEPLPGAWSGLPEVEFIPGITEPPDVWYLPSIENRPALPLSTTRPVHLQILVNTTASERTAASITAVRRNMSLAVPALKLLAGLRLANGSLDTALLDLTRRRAACEQHTVRQLDWPCIHGYFAAAQPGVVDVAALAGEWKMRQFFQDEVRRRLYQAGDAVQVVIVISGPGFFETPVPVDSEPVPPDPDHQLYYIRYRSTPLRVFQPGRGAPGGGFGRGYPGRARPGMRPPGPEAPRIPMPPDDLQRALEPLGARLFDAASPEDFRRILATILEQVGRH